MNKMALAIVAFLGGAAVAGGASYIFYHEKFNKELDDAVIEVKNYYAKKYEETNHYDSNTPREAKKENSQVENTPDVTDSIAKSEINTASTPYSSKTSETPADPETLPLHPEIQIISEDDYFDAVAEGKDIVEYLYYADHILADENSDVVENVEDTVGTDALAMFDDENIDEVHVYNARLKLYYEILRSLRDYKEDFAYKL